MNLSFWERETWFNEIDFAIVGSGIVGLTCALSLRNRFPNSKIVIFERGLLPNGASTKNAGFACFGSVSEILDDLKSHSEEAVIELVRKRVFGLKLLREILGDHTIDYQENGGYELFPLNDEALFEECMEKLEGVNNLLKETIFNGKSPFLIKNDPFSFKNIRKQVIFNQFEGQLDTGKMMQSLIQKCLKSNIFILNSFKIESYLPKNNQIQLNFVNFGEIYTQKLLIATNGFANDLISKENIVPARAQVLITSPIENASIKGTFHLDRGYYYFRNVGNRILLGGGRNLDFSGETTTQMQVTQHIQEQLEALLRTTILPNKTFTIEQRWSGIMGVGNQKSPIVKELTRNVYCGVRLGGMGVAIGSLVGKELADLASL
ncbi:MAG TPA: FAD-dependent oxidoreductase [Flavobacteriaceae bacterium]|nr:FAD-binding oxidoreductase [Flavobacteriaceae bacterium]MCB9211977.1 FAD-binding oxidoreductase [Alteromonas sp.]HPF09929.1 FAD-dependent oxidoreductase [Flavobacteriaceae bacterium]HQU20026.1 FAD-dependent oxidoreductase [Flavobacteriaceae bacterium]HQU63988.1 FAD-dependent oxidoreductase [Flavobacteriaceae bacterium]